MRTEDKNIQAQQINYIIDFVCQEFEISKTDLISKRQFKKLVEARFLVAYSARMINPEISDETIGQRLKKSRWAIWKITNKRIGLMYADKAYSNHVNSHLKLIINGLKQRVQGSSNCFIKPVQLVTLNEFKTTISNPNYLFRKKRNESFY